MASEIFSWGYTAWRSQRPNGFEVCGFVDGREVSVLSDTPDSAERQFCRAARSAWLRRKLRRLCGLPARESVPLSSADTYQDVSLARMLAAILKGTAEGMCQQLAGVVGRRL